MPRRASGLIADQCSHFGSSPSSHPSAPGEVLIVADEILGREAKNVRLLSVTLSDNERCA